MRDTLARPKGEPQTCLQVDEHYGTIFKFLAHNPICREPKAVPIEA
jgi:hypothetical protein